MSWKIVAAFASGLLSASSAYAQSTPAKPQIVAASGCDASDRIDGSTIEMAREKLEKAGFRQITELKKACDNFWHSRAMKDGAPVNVLVTPKGQVMVEGD